MTHSDENGKEGCTDEDCSDCGPGCAPADPRGEADQLMRYMDAVNAQLDAMNRQGEVTQMALDDNVRARRALERLEKVEEGSETLVPIGAGTFVKARAGAGDHVMISLGKGVVADLSADKVQDILLERHETLTDQQLRITGGIDSLRQQASSLQNRLEELAGMMQNQG